MSSPEFAHDAADRTGSAEQAAGASWRFEIVYEGGRDDAGHDGIRTGCSKLPGLLVQVRQRSVAEGMTSVTVRLRAKRRVCSGCGAKGPSDQEAPGEELAAISISAPARCTIERRLRDDSVLPGLLGTRTRCASGEGLARRTCATSRT